MVTIKDKVVKNWKAETLIRAEDKCVKALSRATHRIIKLTKGVFSMKANIDQKVQENIIKEYQAGETLAALGKKYNLSTYLVKRVLRDCKINLRPAGNQTQRKYETNDSFFDIQNHDMAYVLGLLASDGNVSKRENAINFVASEQDISHLEKIRCLLGSTKPIKCYIDNKGNHSCRLSIHSKQYKKILADYNIVPAKTKTYIFSYKLQREFWKDFLRGYFDGDGSISPSGNGVKWQIGSYNKEILEWIIDYLYDEYNISKPAIYKSTNRHFFQITYARQEDTEKIYHILYDGERICLERKKIKFGSLLRNKIPRDYPSSDKG